MMRKLDRPLYPASEATAAGFTRSELANLIRYGVAPPPLHTAVRGGTPLWSTRGLAELATMGAVYAGLPSLLLAARLGAPLFREHLAVHGHTPSRLNAYLGIPVGRRLRGPECLDERGEVDHWLQYLNAREFSDAVREGRASAAAGPSGRPVQLYTPGAARDDDIRFGVADSTHVFEIWRLISPVSAVGNDKSPLGPAFRISGWRRAAAPEDIRLEPYESFLSPGWWEEGTDARRAAAALELEWREAWANATSRIEVNVSLAIRNAFDRIYAMRRSRST